MSTVVYRWPETLSSSLFGRIISVVFSVLCVQKEELCDE